MLHCTACRSALSPFAQHRPVVDEICPHCATELRIHRRGGREQEVEGPALPPVPPEVTVEGDAPRPGAYREAPRAGTFRIRWKDRVDRDGKAALGLGGAMTLGGLVGALVHPIALFASAYGASVAATLGSWPRSGELVLGPSDLSFRIGRLRAWRTLPREVIDVVRVVAHVDSQGARSHYRVVVRHGGAWTLVARPRTSAVAHYIAASLRVTLPLDGG